MIRLSYVCSTAKPLVAKTVGDVLRDTARRHPLAEACVFPKEGVRWSYAELLQRSEEVAQGLLSLGLPQQSRIGVFTPNISEFVLSVFATAFTGNVLDNINPAYREGELENALSTVSCSALIMSESFKNVSFVEMLTKLCPEIPTSKIGELEAKRCPSLKWLIKIGNTQSPGFIGFQDLYRRRFSEFQKVSASVNYEMPYNIQFTSGTTGKPKAATLTHHGLVNNDAFFGRHMRFSPSERICIPVPLHHSFGMGMGLLASVIHGSTVVTPDLWFSPISTLEAIESEKCTCLYGVPTMLQSILNKNETAGNRPLA